MAIDERFIKALHVESLRKQELHEEHEPHVIFQTSTIEALLEGAYDGDISFRELAAHGDLGLGTFDACDGEMIAVEGSFLRAAVDGSVGPVDGAAKTPFAVLTDFDPSVRFEIEAPLGYAELVELMERHVGTRSPCHAVRIDGRFELVKARSVARQRKPYPPLVEVVKHQHVFEFRDVDGTIVGFRFPDYAQGLNAAGYHLHFVSADRTRGGHVLDCRTERATVQIDQSSELHIELPAGVEMTAPDTTDATRAALHKVERELDAFAVPQPRTGGRVGYGCVQRPLVPTGAEPGGQTSVGSLSVGAEGTQPLAVAT